jgi:hypothetical protein
VKRTNADGYEPDKNGAGRNGFKDTGPNPTTVDETVLNAWQEEIARTIELSGSVLDDGDNEQLYGAIESRIGARFPASSTDNHIVRFDGASGELLQDSSPVAVSDAGAITGVTSLAMDGALTGVTDATASGDFLYASPKTRTVLLLGSELKGAGWVGGNAGQGTCTIDSSPATAQLPVPQGATLTSVRISVSPGTARATPANRVQVSVSRVTGVSTVGVPTGAVTGWTDATDAGTALGQFVGDTNVSHAHLAGELLRITVTGGNNAASFNDIVFGIEVVYTEPRPGGPI